MPILTQRGTWEKGRIKYKRSYTARIRLYWSQSLAIFLAAAMLTGLQLCGNPIVCQAGFLEPIGLGGRQLGMAGAAIAGCRGAVPTKPGGGCPKHRSYFQTSIAMYFSLSDLQPLVAAAATSRIGIHAAIRGRCHIVVICVSPGLKGHL